MIELESGEDPVPWFMHVNWVLKINTGKVNWIEEKKKKEDWIFEMTKITLHCN
jgi:hypothetical protein